MQQLDALTLKALAAELDTLLGSAKVSKIQHPSAHEFLITFWGGAPRSEHANLLYIHLNPEMPFTVLTDTRKRQNLTLHEFEKPTTLCMLLRKHLNGGSVLGIHTLPGERVLNVLVENFNELGNRVRLVLSLELMGKHTNMILYDEVQNLILGVAHGVSERMSSFRELAPGLPYAPPPRVAGKRLLSELTSQEFTAVWHQKPADESAVQYLNRQIAGLGQRMLEDALATTSDPQTLFQHLNHIEAGESLFPARDENSQRFTLVAPQAASHWIRYASVNTMLADYFTARLQSVRMGRKRQQLLDALSAQEKKLRRRRQELIPIGDEEIKDLQATGDRLLAAVSTGELPPEPRKGSVTLTRYEDNAPWPIEIDPVCSWVENAQIYYRRAKKAKARKEIYGRMAEALQHEEEYLLTLKQMAAQADTLQELRMVQEDMETAGFLKRAASPTGKKEDPLPGIVKLHSSEGFEILLGKSGQGNDAIVGKLSKPDDVWLHVHQMPGSHVLVKTRKTQVTDETLLEAAMLAAWYSAARDSVNVPVIHTEARYVRKIPGSYPGHVNYRHEKTVFVTPDPVRIKNLTE